MNIETIAWPFKYAPKTIDDIILSDKNREYFNNLKDIPNNYLFVGLPGAGKTTLAKILAKKFAPTSYLFLNASDESGIETVRTKIKDFIETMSLDGAQKIVILDECDGFSPQAQDALRFLMEEFLDDVKFILTGNHKNKIREALQSRCIMFDFAVDIKAVFQRVLSICASENISLDIEQKKNLAQIVKMCHPDIRKTINHVQRCCQSGEFVYNKNEPEIVSKEIFTMLKEKTPVWDIRKYTISNEGNFSNDYLLLMRNLFDLFVEDKNVSAVMYIVDSIYKHAIVSDPEINFMGLLINLSK
jgi:replication factor C small subunit